VPSPQQRRNTDPGDAEHGSHPRRHHFDVVEGSVRIYVQSMFGGPGRRNCPYRVERGVMAWTWD
jgi:hypothetical protein